MWNGSVKNGSAFIYIRGQNHSGTILWLSVNTLIDRDGITIECVAYAMPSLHLLCVVLGTALPIFLYIFTPCVHVCSGVK